MDISNGPGVRVSVFMQGCTFNCKNCFNKETHDFNGGKEFTDEIIDKVLELCGKDYIIGLSILGGEPMHPKNIDGTLKLAKKFNKPVIAFAGSVTKEAIECNKNGIDAFFPILRSIVTLEEAMKPENAKVNMTNTAEQVFRLWNIR